MKKIYITPVIKAAAMICNPLMVDSVHTGNSQDGGSGGGRQGANNAFFEEEEDDAPLRSVNVWE